MKRRVLLFASKTGYQVREFYEAAEQLGVDLVLATDRCHILEDPWGDRATPLRFETVPEDRDIDALRARGPFDGVLAVGDRPAFIAACCAEALGVTFHSRNAAQAANDKYLTRQRFRAAGLNVPRFELLAPGQAPDHLRFPCVLKPLHLSASRGVIRTDSREEFIAAEARIHKMTGVNEPLLVEDFIPGPEFALEGVVTAGRLQVLAIFDKPDPLNGPFFEETIYVTPSRQPARVQRDIEAAAQRAVSALGLCQGPVHAEMRVNAHGVWMLEVAARPIGGLCSRVLRFEGSGFGGDGSIGLEELLLRHAIGQDVSGLKLAPGAHGVMMIPVPRAGVFSRVDGVQQARSTADIESVEITAKEGQIFQPLPEGASYLGFLFARSQDSEQAERTLRQAHGFLHFQIEPVLPVVK